MLPPRARATPFPAALALLLGLSLLVSFPASQAAAAPAGPEDFDGFAAAFRKDLEDESPATRLRAFQQAAEHHDPRVVDLLVEGTEKEALRRDALAKEQGETETGLEAVLSEIEKGNKTTPKTPKEIDAYNKKMKVLEAKRDAANSKLRDFAADLAQVAAVVGAGVEGLGKALALLEKPASAAALDKLEAAWGTTKSPADSRIRFADVVAAVKGPESTKRLRAIAVDEVEDTRVRVAAIGHLAARSEDGTADDFVSLLPSSAWPVVAAAIDGLRRVHRREGIEPLIAFLGRGEEIGRLRTDAELALRSLTGESHGAYAQPWQAWWDGAKATFKMPPSSQPVGGLRMPEKGTTFFGITTFSYHVLYVLDISGSMLDPAHPTAPGTRGKERKIDLARRELLASIDMLDEHKTFNIVFFNHKVIRYQAGAVDADKPQRERAKRFAAELEPTGGTNINDALETAFRMANAFASGKDYKPIFDTIMFMTDGTPTAGKLQKPDQILAAVAEWNRTAQMTIHVVGLGDECDEKFLAALATLGNGAFVRR